MGITKLDGRVLDFWEREFPDISPRVQKDGEKTYTREDLLLILQIRKWMVEERKSRQEVRALLANPPVEPCQGSAPPVPQEAPPPPTGDSADSPPPAVRPPASSAEDGHTRALAAVREGLQEILTLLETRGTL